MHDDIDYDTESYFNQFFCITVGTRLAAMMFEREDAQDVAVELESDPRDLHPLLFADRVELERREEMLGMAWTPLTPRVRDALDAMRCTSGPVAKLVNIGPDNHTAYLASAMADIAKEEFSAAYQAGRSWRPDIIFAHPPCRPEYEKVRDRPDFTPEAGPVVSAALALPDITEAPLIEDGKLSPIACEALKAYGERFIQLWSRKPSTDAGESLPVDATMPYTVIGDPTPDDVRRDTFNRDLEAHARTWGDHGELFELPEGWWFQDNMIQNKPAIDLVVVITYDADNLPNPWEWQLHEPAPCSLMGSPWDQVPSTNDKPRAGWAPTLIAAMTRSATAAQLHLDDRRAAGGA